MLLTIFFNRNWRTYKQTQTKRQTSYPTTSTRMLTAAVIKWLALFCFLGLATTTSASGYCNYGPDGTGATSTCNGQVQGGDWCNQKESQCLTCNGKWCTNGTPANPPSPVAPSNPPPTPPSPTPPTPVPPTGLPAGFATTTRYWDCSGGACGCAYLANGEPGKETHCHR
jgi:hypothetical protein